MHWNRIGDSGLGRDVRRRQRHEGVVNGIIGYGSCFSFDSGKFHRRKHGLVGRGNDVLDGNIGIIYPVFWVRRNDHGLMFTSFD